jgi:hypothetical protein
MLRCMAGTALSDDVALCSAAIAGVVRILASKGMIAPVDIVRVASSAGISESQAGQFSRGELTLPPHQALTLVVAAFERLRIQQVSAAELRAETSAIARRNNVAEETEAGALAEVEQLTRDFPSWRPRVEDLDTIAAGRPRLIWAAKHRQGASTWPEVSGRTAKELRGKLTQIEARLKHDAEQLARYQDGRGVASRSVG